MPIHSFGSLNLDYVYAVDHFVQGGETMAALGRQVFAGGKGLNQSIALARAGAKVYHAGKVGPDGAMLTQLLQDAGADISHVMVEPEVPTGHAIIQVDNHSGQNCIIIYPGANGCLTPDFIDQALSKAGRENSPCSKTKPAAWPTAWNNAIKRGFKWCSIHPPAPARPWTPGSIPLWIG